MKLRFNPQDHGWTWDDVFYRARSTFAVLLSITVLLGGAIFVGYKAKHAWDDYRQQDDYVGAGTDDVTVTIPRGASNYRISDILVANDVIKDAKKFDIVAAQDPKSQNIQAGRHKLKKHIPAAAALKMLLDPDLIIRTKFTIIEGTRLSSIVAKLGKPEVDGGTAIAQSDYEKVLAENIAELGLPAYAKNNPEGYLFPDTYAFASDGSALSILQQMISQYNAVAGDIGLEAKAKNLNYSPDEIVTIASIIENEVRSNQDRAKVASVIMNRLDQGMPLQMDSTVHYAVGKEGHVTTTDEERKSSSPYNTYLVKGLPPTPIGSPGKASLNAALNPEQTNYLYFVTVDLDSGETKFTENLDDHNKNVAQFQAWCQAHTGRC
ncbi:MAG: endolytic transglycosylase MltG [Propionibacteriaceae bacterium]